MCPCAVQSQWSAVVAWMGWGSYVSADESHLPWRGAGRACVCVCVCVFSPLRGRHTCHTHSIGLAHKSCSDLFDIQMWQVPYSSALEYGK